MDRREQGIPTGVPEVVVERVHRLVMGDIVTGMLDADEGRDDVWAESASACPEYASRITSLRGVRKRASLTRKTSEAMATALHAWVAPVSDQVAQSLLHDLLIDRVTDRDGAFVAGSLDEVDHVANILVRKLGITGYMDPELVDLGGSEVVTAILDGRLDVDPPPYLQKPFSSQ